MGEHCTELNWKCIWTSCGVSGWSTGALQTPDLDGVSAAVDAVVTSSHPDNVRKGLLDETDDGKLLTRFCSMGLESSISMALANGFVFWPSDK